jgi:hypothetical protein
MFDGPDDCPILRSSSQRLPGQRMQPLRESSPGNSSSEQIEEETSLTHQDATAVSDDDNIVRTEKKLCGPRTAFYPRARRALISR